MESNWEYGEKYNSLGEFNPRLIACDNCGIYNEPDTITEWGVCEDCEVIENA